MKVRHRSSRKKRTLTAVDLFCGAGGLTLGLRKAKVAVAAGIDVDSSCSYAVEANNPGTRFLNSDVARLTGAQLADLYPAGTVKVLAGCAPCQPFSRYTVRSGEDNRWTLLHDFLRLAIELRPAAVTMENVPELHERSHPAYVKFVNGLRHAGYNVTAEVVDCSDFAVPQTRRRLVLLAGAEGKRIDLLRPRRSARPTVHQAIGALPPVRAGAPSPSTDPLHVAPALSKKNMCRIQATPEGGGWQDWADGLRLACHKKASGRYYGSVYGRMSWHDLAPTLTTQCFGYGNGRFGHPEQNRAITLREAALLQTFPRRYRFTPPGTKPGFAQVGRHIGNAVPVSLAKAIGVSLRRQLL
jgi:DNA (cytosine-5)-methyltransferase 1